MNSWNEIRKAETAVIAAKVRLYDAENRVCGYALTNAVGRGVSVSFAYDGSYVTNATYVLPDGGIFSARLTREAARKELVTRRDYDFGGQPAYWYATDYDLLGRPTNATDSASLARKWFYNRRSELAAATIGTNRYAYSYDTVGNRLWSAANATTNEYTHNALNQILTVHSPQFSILNFLFCMMPTATSRTTASSPMPTTRRTGWCPSPPPWRRTGRSGC